MQVVRVALLGWILVTTVACQGEDALSVPDLAVRPVTDLAVVLDFALPSACGQAGDVGNALGVGEYCARNADCADNAQAQTCSALGNAAAPAASDTYYCTFLCQPGSGKDRCGSEAECRCSGGFCGCVPARCLPSVDLGTRD